MTSVQHSEWVSLSSLLQAKELLDYLQGVFSIEPVEVVPGSSSIAEVKPQGVSKGGRAHMSLQTCKQASHRCCCRPRSCWTIWRAC